jgi:hypothetical protein
MRSSLVLATALALITATAPLANAQNLVSNPGFETGDFTGWTQAGFSGLDGVGIPQHSGDYAGQFEWTQYAFDVQATDASTLLEFRFQHILSYWALDDVSVTTSESTVPEPATMTLLATGLAGLAAARKRRRNVA